MPNDGDELHHFGWNACSASLCPWAPHPHVERRYLVVPGVNSSRIHILDTKADPAAARAGEGDRAGDGGQEDRLRRAAHGALRARRDLHQRPRRARRRRAGRHLHPGPRHLRAQGTLGEGSRASALRLRLRLAPGPRHHDHQRVGHAQHGAPGCRPRAAAGREVRQLAPRLGPAEGHAPAEARIWATSTR